MGEMQFSFTECILDSTVPCKAVIYDTITKLCFTRLVLDRNNLKKRYHWLKKIMMTLGLD